MKIRITTRGDFTIRRSKRELQIRDNAEKVIAIRTERKDGLYDLIIINENSDFFNDSPFSGEGVGGWCEEGITKEQWRRFRRAYLTGKFTIEKRWNGEPIGKDRLDEYFYGPMAYLADSLTIGFEGPAWDEPSEQHDRHAKFVEKYRKRLRTAYNRGVKIFGRV